MECIGQGCITLDVFLDFLVVLIAHLVTGKESGTLLPHKLALVVCGRSKIKAVHTYDSAYSVQPWQH